MVASVVFMPKLKAGILLTKKESLESNGDASSERLPMIICIEAGAVRRGSPHPASEMSSRIEFLGILCVIVGANCCLAIGVSHVLLSEMWGHHERCDSQGAVVAHSTLGVQNTGVGC